MKPWTIFFLCKSDGIIHYSFLILINIYIFFSSEKIIEPIQSRCAMLRYSKLSDPQVLAKLLIVCDKENIPYGDDGMEAIVFTAQGISNLKLLWNLASNVYNHSWTQEHGFIYSLPALTLFQETWDKHWTICNQHSKVLGSSTRKTFSRYVPQWSLSLLNKK